MKLVIVESPTKAKTISRFLGKDFFVSSSYGHIRDLPKSTLGVDTENDFTPEYIIPDKSKKTVTELKKLLKKATEVVLATDEDREGEAIAWHIIKALELEKSNLKVSRIVFHEITKEAIEKALQNPRKLDKNLIDAQQARRVLDRLVGYKLSPLLWKKVMRGLSAGRVQSVTVRLVVEREKEREKFESQEYWSIEADLETKKNNILRARLWKRDGKVIKDLELDNKKEVDEIVAKLKKSSWHVENITKKETKRSPLPPFTTSTLQQAASSRLYFSARQTMVIAQQLYEGIKLMGGQEGLITYMRTDSLSLSQTSRDSAQKFISDTYGKQYSAPKVFKTKSKGAQEAHEAIRPTDVSRTPELMKEHLDPKQFKLYQLIWQRFMASQMSQAIFDSSMLEIQTNSPYVFKSNGLIQKFDGFLKVWPQKSSEVELPELNKGEDLSLKSLLPECHETEPPPRYSEATLIKALEENGIGRPSTYAPTIGTIQTRGYIEKDSNRRLFPTDVAVVVNNMLVEHFPKIVDIGFTAKMEQDLDDIAEGKKEWVSIIKDFYIPFEKTIKEKNETLSRTEMVSVRKLGSDPKNKKPITIRIGRYGPYVQRGQKEDEDKPDFGAIPKGTKLEEISLEDALKMLKLPRNIGKTDDDKEIIVGIGRFGPYVKVDKEYASVPEDKNLYEMTKEEALEIFEEAKKTGGKRTIQDFDGEGIKVLNGRFGPYVTDGKINASVPKDKDPAKITLEEAKKILEEKPKRRWKKKI